MRYISSFTRDKTQSLPSKYKKSVKFDSIKRSQGAFFPQFFSLSSGQHQFLLWLKDYTFIHCHISTNRKEILIKYWHTKF